MKNRFLLVFLLENNYSLTFILGVLDNNHKRITMVFRIIQRKKKDGSNFVVAVVVFSVKTKLIP
jgi:hypothetical protein